MKSGTNIVILAFLFAVRVFAETTAQPAAADPTDIAQYGSLVGGVMQQARDAQGGAPELAADTGSMDRRNNQNQAGNQGNAGAVAAAVAGGIMIGTGTPMAASPILSVQLAGLDLIAKGVTELAQSAASKSNSDTNHAGKDTLKMSDGLKADPLAQTGQSTDPKQAAMTPALEQFLKEKGVNPDEFVEKSLAGELSTPQSLAKMFGIGDLSDEDASKAMELSNGHLADIFSKQTPETLKLDESQKFSMSPEGKPTDGSNPTGGGRFSPGSKSGSFTDDFSSSSLAAKAVASASDNAGYTKGDSLVPPSIPVSTGVWNGMLHDLGIAASAAPWEKKMLVEGKLESIGIELPRRGFNIFEKARMRYRKFREWRDGRSIAAR